MADQERQQFEEYAADVNLDLERLKGERGSIYASDETEACYCAYLAGRQDEKAARVSQGTAPAKVQNEGTVGFGNPDIKATSPIVEGTGEGAGEPAREFGAMELDARGFWVNSQSTPHLDDAGEAVITEAIDMADEFAKLKVGASASREPEPSGDEQTDKALSAISNALSKLESQVLRNPDLPEAYRTILVRGWEAVDYLATRASARPAVPVGETKK